MVASGAQLAERLARSGLSLASLPALTLPQSLRESVLDGLRWAAGATAGVPRTIADTCDDLGEALDEVGVGWAVEAAALGPRAIADTCDGFAADLDELEGRVARREDLGRRLRRERRRAARGE